MPTTVTIPLAQVFRTEIAKARSLGYLAQCSVTTTAAAVRLVPLTRSARAAAHRAAPHLPAPVLQSIVPFDHEDERLDALRAAFGTTLEQAATTS